MSYTKRQFITAALEEIGIAGYIFDLSDAEIQGHAQRLDALLATWNAKGIRISYLMASEPENIDLDSETGVPDSANEAIILNLAIRIAPRYGKVVSPDTKISAQKAYNNLLALNSKPQDMQLPGTLPKGSGNRRGYGRNFFPEPSHKINTGQDDKPLFS